jgi:hypothetical protein
MRTSIFVTIFGEFMEAEEHIGKKGGKQPIGFGTIFARLEAEKRP